MYVSYIFHQYGTIEVFKFYFELTPVIPDKKNYFYLNNIFKKYFVTQFYPPDQLPRSALLIKYAFAYKLPLYTRGK